MLINLCIILPYPLRILLFLKLNKIQIERVSGIYYIGQILIRQQAHEKTKDSSFKRSHTKHNKML